MLIHLSIDNFAIAEHLECEPLPGMTVLTGETGAGKSILLDALGLALGTRSDSTAVRHGCERADVHAVFDIRGLPDAREWLAGRDLMAGDECLLRRVVTAEGRSRGYINGRPATLPDLKALGELLVEIHGQHAHQALLKKAHQRRLLDAFAGCHEIADQVRRAAQQRQQIADRLATAAARRDQHDARVQLLRYQISELDDLGLTEEELANLEAEQKELANGEHILRCSQQAVAYCKEGEINVASILGQAVRALQESASQHKALTEAEQMLASALIQVEEASHELQRYLDGFELDPERLQAVQDRLSAIYDISRKHRIAPPELPTLHQRLREELADLIGGDASIEHLEAELCRFTAAYFAEAKELSKQRSTAARKLEKQVEKQLQSLSMGGCHFRVSLSQRAADAFNSHGAEDVEFLISTNPGTDPQPLQKIASGGELSRISLAIQVVTAQTSATPTLVFDEVDVGIGGATAEVVGRLLRELGERGQVLCVTHQAQVASKAQHHLKVEKVNTKNSVRVSLQPLGQEGKIEEIARMMGGLTITDQSLAHAREMIALTH